MWTAFTTGWGSCTSTLSSTSTFHSSAIEKIALEKWGNNACKDKDDEEKGARAMIVVLRMVITGCSSAVCAALRSRKRSVLCLRVSLTLF